MVRGTRVVFVAQGARIDHFSASKYIC